MLTIVAAMEEELVLLRKQLAREAGPSGPETPASADLRVIGVGRSAVETALSSLLQPKGLPGDRSHSPERLLLLGFAGGVDPSLKAGTLVLSSRYYRQGPWDPAGDCLTPDPEMLRQGIRAATAATAAGAAWVNTDSLTVDRLVATTEAKRDIRFRHPVGIVEMEHYWVATAAREAGVPFLSARVILDAADQALPGYLMGLTRSRSRIAVTVAATPWRVPALLGLARRLSLSQRVLTRFATAFLAQLAGAEGAQVQSGQLSRVMPSGSHGALPQNCHSEKRSDDPDSIGVVWGCSTGAWSLDRRPRPLASLGVTLAKVLLGQGRPKRPKESLPE